jgi:hypothetical protein
VVTTGKLHWKRFGFTTTHSDCAPTNVEAVAAEKAVGITRRANPSKIADADRTDIEKSLVIDISSDVAATMQDVNLTIPFKTHPGQL